LRSKESAFLISNIIIVASISLIVYALNVWFEKILPNIYIRALIALIVTISLYYFLAVSVIREYLSTDKKLKEMIDHTLHELNTPIATIEANVSMLKKTIDQPKNLSRLNRISEASKNLTALYESIEYNIKEKIEQIEKIEFDLRKSIDESIRRFYDIKGCIRIENLCETLTIRTDRNGFERVLDNLLSNAIKYNKKGGFVKFFTKNRKLYIQDSGIGIDPKNLLIVYEKSFQENPSTEGFGLGLGIVKDFCDKEKIEIKIDTKKNYGTTISLDLENIVKKD